MIYRNLGRTGIMVSSLAMGVLTIGPLQRSYDIDSGAAVLVCALHNGINFFDTAQIYRTYPYIRRAMDLSGMRPVICGKSFAHTETDMRHSLEEALDELGIGCIDIFMLHEQESELTLKGHREALQYLVKAREKGWIKAAGLSTHSVKGVLAGIKNPHIGVIHPIINRRGLGIMDGSREQMLAAVYYAHMAGKGVYAMKIFGGGNLFNEARVSMKWVQQYAFIDSIAIGMGSEAEVALNMAWMENREDSQASQMVVAQKRRVMIEEWCSGCESCIDHCRYEAISATAEGNMTIDHEKCILCGYCSAFCPDFCIKII